MTWYNKLEIYYLFNNIPIHFYLSLLLALYLMSILTCIVCIIHDLSTLGVTKNIQVMCYLQVDDLFSTNLWI